MMSKIDKCSSLLGTKEHPFSSKLVEKTRLTSIEGEKETYLLRFDLGESGITYEPGDVLGILPKNNYGEVRYILSMLNFSGKEMVKVSDGQNVDLETALLSYCCLNRPTKRFIEIFKPNAINAKQREYFHKVAEEHEQVTLLEFIQHCPKPIILGPQDVIDGLSALRPRYYSIASSQRAHKRAVELVVVRLWFETAMGANKEGVASSFLCNHLGVNEGNVDIFVKRSKFKLPENDEVPVIMVGPGSGIAPFKGFLEERRERKAIGGNWLFFGDRYRKTDFLLKELWGHLMSEGVLSRFDVAFSRDQPQKIYVQDKLLENSKELWEWIKSGAYFYVCGDARRMAKDVQNALLSIFQSEGNLSEDEAQAYLKLLKAEGRYQRDVY